MKLNEIEIYQKLASKEISYDEAKEFLRLLHKGSETVSKNENKLEEIKQQIIDIMRQLLHIEKSELNINENLKELGVDSINAAEIVYEMNRVFGTNLDTTVIYDYVTIAALSDYIYSLQSNRFKQNGERVYEKDVTCKEESPIKKDTMEIIKNEIVEIVGKVLHIEPEKIDINMSFNDLGIDSINGVEIVKAINDSFKTNLDTVTLYDYSTIIDLSKHLIMEIDRNSKILNSKDMVQSKTKAVKGIEGNLRKRKTPPFQLKTVRKQTIPHIAANSATNRIVLKQKQSSEEQAISLEDTLRKHK
ncbi:PtzD protein [Streptococcus troglodytae]|uniref:PtzD protein n=1 Tax=Streptococcus troglodytae TaxID=1111760 RepID=A0A1L7LJM5_9STRE|nr:acyl carrier protein [Streptococcus troglodytae]BAQ24330.1 PtzD protein [Streptococcus troglodytae]